MNTLDIIGAIIGLFFIVSEYALAGSGIYKSFKLLRLQRV